MLITAMPRPCLNRRICCNPRVVYFKPLNACPSQMPEAILQLDELEALRLADLEGLYHEEAASKMNISRQTFDRIISKARFTLADAIINGKAINIKGGPVMTNQRTFICADCQYHISIPYGTGRPNECPKCQSKNIHRTVEERGPGRGAGRRNRGRCLRRGQVNID